MTWARVQNVTSLTSSITIAAPTIGNLLLAYTVNSNAANVPTISGSGWTKAGFGNFGGCGVWFKIAGASEPTTITITQTSGVSFSVGAVEYSGNIGAVGGVNFSNSNSGASTTAVANVNPINLSAGGIYGDKCLYVAFGFFSGMTAGAPTSPFWTGGPSPSLITTQTLGSSALSWFFEQTDVTVAGAGQYNGTLNWTNSVTATSNVAGALVIFPDDAISYWGVGAISNVSAASVTPAFPQTTTAGNLLIARVAKVTNNTVPVTTSTGWVKAVDSHPDTSGDPITTSIFYRPNCGAAETAPTFTAAGATAMFADLMEIAGADPVSPLDISTGLNQGAIGAWAQLQSALDTTNSDLCIYVAAGANSKSATCTFSDSWSPGGGAAIAAQGTGATKQSNHAWFSAYLLNGNGGAVADQNAVTATPSTGSFSGSIGASASFKVVAATTSLLYDDRRIRRNSLLRR